MATFTATALVYGQTVAAVFAACAIADQGVDVALVSPTEHLGGPLRNGLGATDMGRRGVKGVNGYLPKEYFRVFTVQSGRLYTTQYRASPSLVDQTLRHMIYKRVAKITVFAATGYAVASAAKTGAVVNSITTTNGDVFNCTYWMDCTEDGEMAQKCGLTMKVGRESQAQYGEPFAGFQPAWNSFRAVDTRDSANNLLFGIEPLPSLAVGDADNRTQAFTFRVAATDDANLRIRWPKPSGYDPALFELERRLNSPETNSGFRPFHRAYCIDGVMDINGDWGRPAQNTWPSGTAVAKEAVRQTAYNHQFGWYWFLANDQSVHPDIRGFVASIGLVRGEFTDTGYAYSAGVPYELYTRVCTRLVGRYVMTQFDVQTTVTKPDDGISCGFYSLDEHSGSRYEVTVSGVRGIISDGFGVASGDPALLQTQPYQIPYRCALPQAAQCTNGLVPVAASTSYVAMASMRIDIHKANFASACGVAIGYAANQGITNLHDNYDTLSNMTAIKALLTGLGHVWQIPT